MALARQTAAIFSTSLASPLDQRRQPHTRYIVIKRMPGLMTIRRCVGYINDETASVIRESRGARYRRKHLILHQRRGI